MHRVYTLCVSSVVHCILKNMTLLWLLFNQKFKQFYYSSNFFRFLMMFVWFLMIFLSVAHLYLVMGFIKFVFASGFKIFVFQSCHCNFFPFWIIGHKLLFYSLFLSLLLLLFPTHKHTRAYLIISTHLFHLLPLYRPPFWYTKTNFCLLSLVSVSLP